MAVYCCLHYHDLWAGCPLPCPNCWPLVVAFWIYSTSACKIKSRTWQSCPDHGTFEQIGTSTTEVLRSQRQSISGQAHSTFFLLVFAKLYGSSSPVKLLQVTQTTSPSTQVCVSGYNIRCPNSLLLASCPHAHASCHPCDNL